MGKVTGFLEFDRSMPMTRPVVERVNDYKELYIRESSEFVNRQASRCMDCGIPFCQSGCPLGNIIPEFNDAVYRESWFEAYHILCLTNNFPEFTGRLCPAPCEGSCVLGLNADAVTIEYIEKQIIETAFDNGWVNPSVPTRNGLSVAIIGSGPSGLAAADELNKMGYDVTIYEKSAKPGGLLRYGIPDFKLEKHIIDRRIRILQQSGIIFICDHEINSHNIDDLDKYNAVLLCGGSTVARDIDIHGRQTQGIHLAMDYLQQSNEFVDQRTLQNIHAAGKHVVVIGGGDTGADCVGTAARQGALSINQLEFMFKPDASRDQNNPWPQWPMILRKSTSHDEGCTRQWSVMTKSFIKNDDKLSGLLVCDVDWEKGPDGKYSFIPKENSNRIIPCDLVLIAIGFLSGQTSTFVNKWNVGLETNGNISTSNYQTSNPKIFSAGDMRRGQSLIVWAIQEGREAAKSIDNYLINQ
jgi:glutamate synthase (NADPH) small chain